MKETSEVKDLIKFYRNEKKISQEELAEKLGVSRVTITRYENGTRVPSIDMLRKIAKALDVPPIRIFGQFKDEVIDNIFKKTGYDSEATMKKFNLKLISDYLDLLDKEGQNTASQIVRLLSKLNSKGQEAAKNMVIMTTKIDEYKRKE